MEHRGAVRCVYAIATGWLLWFATFAHATLTPTDLRCEYLKNPLGLQLDQPRLSWILPPSSRSARGEKQTAYQILAASTQKKLDANQGDLWDSGQVKTNQSIHVLYSGKALAPDAECFWKVRAWDQDGKVSSWSKPAHWSKGPLWHAAWIGKDETETTSRLDETFWIWFPEGKPADSAPIGHRYFRRGFELPQGAAIKSAKLLVTADNSFNAYVNGEEVGSGGNFKAASAFDVSSKLHPGKNLLALTAHNSGENANPAGLIAKLVIELADGTSQTVVTDENWQSSKDETTGWEKADFNDATWVAAMNLGKVGIAPWGEVSAPEDRRLAARYLRKEFSVEKKVQRATAYICGLGLSELYLNGKKISDHVLSPALSEYNKRDFYVTHDVTEQIGKGENAIGVILGNGRFFAPRLKVPTETRTYGFPKLLFQLRLDYADGSSEEVLSDGTWRLTTHGPIRANNEYDGEEFDATMEMPGWSKPGFDDAAWENAKTVSSPGGIVSPQMIEPIRVTQTIKPVCMNEIKPGVYIFDLGQNIAGWCRLKVSGPRGSQVSLRHAETLRPDGSLYLDNIRSAKVTDIYTLKGKGTEIYEPRFTIHGFRYVELKGFPGKPSLSTLEGRVVHDDLESAGEFACSNPLLNQIYKNIVWGLRDNYRSIPTDCPQRDERQGWLGDRCFESKGETYIFNTAALYSKWLGDIADAQKENGSVSDVCPSYWPLYNDNVTWPSVTVGVPEMLYQQFGDIRIIADHYDSMKKWIDHMSTYVKDDIISKDSYGDWCVPPEEQKLIHSQDPKRKTNPALLATAYFCYDLQLMSQYASRLGKDDDAARFQKMAAKMRAAFNAKFYNHDLGQYDNGTQTSCVLPLAFHLVADDQRTRVFDHLVKKIAEETDYHLGTGLVGGQWLNRVLTDNGRPDLACKIATQTSYPSWGYMLSKGATTIWELWNGDTADPAMNSGNHLMLVGDLTIWMNENLAGIQSSCGPGFRIAFMAPQPTGDLKWVRSSHRSPYGTFVSEWKHENGRFQWDITIPPNTIAYLTIPADDPDSIREHGRPFAKKRPIAIGSGTYHFESKLN